MGLDTNEDGSWGTPNSHQHKTYENHFNEIAISKAGQKKVEKLPFDGHKG